MRNRLRWPVRGLGVASLASEPGHRLPMIIHWPGITDQSGVAATRNDALLYNIDYAPGLGDYRYSGWR
ncbi:MULTISPECIES: hypothetical protein [unclassified Pseudarthrobacter]|uniref:hypothetical protein n=1 Tax=unclassified Pseudarthrobacter TaxID=2647000 RepID=UPI002499CFA7|nr:MULTISPECIES: hypothetical protein [unclassified Pseudarthrobacter]MDI3195842.1 hypothetical protein [Pseudarthrobacter sp. AL20]